MTVRRLLICAAVAVLALAMLAGAACVVLESDWGRERVRRLAVKQASEVLAGQLSIGHISGSFWRGVTLEQVALRQDGEDVFRADRITVRYDLLTLVRRKILLDDVLVEAPVLRAIDEGAGWNVARLLRPTNGGGDSTFSIAQLHVRNGDVTIQSPGMTSRHVSAVDLDGRVARAGGDLTIRIDRARADDEGSGFVLRQFHGSLVNGLDQVHAAFTADSGDARASGQVATTADQTHRHVDVTADVTRLDLSRVLSDQWASDITARITLRVDVPRDASPVLLKFTAEGPHVSAFGYEGTDYKAVGSYAAGRLTFDASAAGYGARATIHAVWAVSARDGFAPGLVASGRFQSVALARLPASLALPPLATKLSGGYRVNVDSRGWGADVVMDTSTVENATIGPRTVGHVDVHDGAIAYRASGHIANVDVRRLADPLDLPTLAAPRFQSSLTGTFQIEGNERCQRCAVHRRITAHAALEQASIAGSHVDGADLSLELEGSRLTLTGRGEFTELSAEALGLPQPVTVALNGWADGSVVLPDISAPVAIDTVAVNGRVDLSPSTVQGVAVREAHAEGTLDGGVAMLREFEVDGPGGHASACGSLALGSTGESALDAIVESQDLRAVGQAIARPLSGSAYVTTRVTGDSQHPVVTGTIRARELAYADQASALTFNASFATQVPEWDLKKASIDGQSAGTFLRVAGVDIATLAATAKYADDRLDLELKVADEKRTLDASGVVTLQPSSRSVQLQKLAVTTGDATWALPADQRATIRSDDAQIYIDGLRLQREGQSVSATGTLALAPGAASRSALMVKAEQVEIADINQMLLGSRTLTGRANGTIAVTGSLADPSIDVDVTVANGSVEGTHFDAVAARATIGAGVVSGVATLDQTSSNRVTVTGRVPWRAASSSDALDLQVQSTPIDLGLAQLFTTELTKIEGTGEVNLQLTGSLRAPVVNGTLRLTGGAFTVASSGVHYRGLTADAGFRANRLSIETLRMTDDSNHEVHVEGGVDVFGDEARRSLDLHVISDSLHVLDSRLGSLQLDADLTITGELTAPAVQGTVRLDSGRLEVDQILERTTASPYSETPSTPLTADLAPTLDSAAPRGEGQQAEVLPGLFDHATVAVTLDLPDNLVMRGRDLRVGPSTLGLGDMNVIVGGTLELRKTVAGPFSVLGTLSVVRGSYAFQGRRFDVQRGSDVRFRGGDPTNPVLDVTAERDVSGVAAQVHLKGTARAPSLSLSSRPPLDDADVLSLIVFGQPVNDLGSGERTSLAARAGAMAAGVIATPIADSVARALDLDLFEIQAPTDTERAPVVSAGSQIGSHLYIGVTQEVGGDASSAVSFEYRITRFLRLVTSFAQGALQSHVASGASAGAVDLMFVFRF